jgi:hypothetical protein
MWLLAANLSLPAVTAISPAQRELRARPALGQFEFFPRETRGSRPAAVECQQREPVSAAGEFRRALNAVICNSSARRASTSCSKLMRSVPRQHAAQRQIFGITVGI